MLNTEITDNRKAHGSVLCSRYSVIDAAEWEVGGEKDKHIQKSTTNMMMGGKLWEEKLVGKLYDRRMKQ